MDGFEDASLGMSSGASPMPQASQEMVDAATQMLRSVRPFGGAAGNNGTSNARRGGRGDKRGGRGGRGRGGRGRAGGSGGGSGSGGGGGGGGSGSGRNAPRGGDASTNSGPSHAQPAPQPYSGPGLNRPLVSTFIVNHGMRQLIGQFASESLVYALQQQNYQTMMALDEETKRQMGLPDTVQQYHSLCPLENFGPSVSQSSSVVSIPTLALKAIHHGDGAGYMLRRLDGRHIIPTPELLETCREVVMKWSVVANHPNVVGLREAFVSDEIMETPAVFLTFDYHPGACTLEQLFVKSTPAELKAQNMMLTEEDIWSFLVQMTSALRAIHEAGLEVGPAALHPSKVLLCSPNRVRLGFLGVSDILIGPSRRSDSQLVDLSALGTLMVTVACAARNELPNLEAVMVHYSRDLFHVLAGLVSAHKGSGFKDWRNLAAALGPRAFDELDANQATVDTMSMEMMKEIENGRIARFLVKLNMVRVAVVLRVSLLLLTAIPSSPRPLVPSVFQVVERGQLNGDQRWSETGDRYLLKLFRDFVFHQVDELGNPVNDWGLVVEAINKADAGLEEKIILLSRDGKSMLVVSYADVQRCLVMAYNEIAQAAGDVTQF